ncbi:MAG: hypothetical protein LW860_18360 [Xanthomonadaceae bacterium]|jgi:hypothetical protein|nr:hypothetical protein [Xanthomonadaceae bacterium]
MADILTGEGTNLWHELVREGEQRARQRLDEDAEAYLVFTLMRHHRDVPLAHRTMALELLEALRRSGRRREDDLRDVGDRCLLLAGFYPDLAQRRRVDLGYFVALGRGAYAQLADELRAALAQLYAQLAQDFDRLVRVLMAVRALSGEWRGPDPMTAHALSLAGPARGDDGVIRAAAPRRLM